MLIGSARFLIDRLISNYIYYVYLQRPTETRYQKSKAQSQNAE